MKQFKLVNTLDGIKSYLGDSKVISFDFETAPNDEYRNEKDSALDAHKSHIVGCSFSNKVDTGIYIPIAHLAGHNINSDEFFNFLKSFLSNSSIIKIAHNLAFESMFSYAKGIVIKAPTYDTMSASQLTMRNDYDFRSLGDSGLKKLAKELLDEDVTTFDKVTNGKFFDELNPEVDIEAVAYGAADSDYALKLYYLFNEWFDKWLPKHRWIVENIESQTSVYLGIMKYNGIPLDIDLMNKRKQETEAEMQKVKDEIKFIIGDVEIGANASTQSFKKYLYEDLKLPVMKVTEKEQAAADDMALVMLKEYCDEHRPELSKLFTLVQEYRKLGKIKSTYIDGYLKYLNPATKRIHPNLFSLSTQTSRMSCNSPNCQNMPRKGNDPVGVRKFIKAPKGHSILSLDFSQIELRVLAFYSQDKHMVKTYIEGGDIHAMTTAVIYNTTYEEAKNKDNPDYKEHRSIAKNTNFGMAYSIFARGLQRTLKFKAGINKTEEKCQMILDNLKAGYPKMVAWQDEAKLTAYKKCYSETWFGYRRYLAGIRSKNWGIKSFAERCALNTPIQGTAAQILKLGCCRILEKLKDFDFIKPILQIHDELVFIVPNDKVHDAVNYIKACMEVKPFDEFNIPLIAEAEAGDTFGSMSEVEETHG